MVPEQLGPYRIGKRLGRGGMGTVYEGENIETGEPAAIKILSATLAHEEAFRERFQAEIETLKKLRHPNIVRLFGYGEQDDFSFFAMELVDGASLEEELRQNQHYSWREVVLIGIQTCLALRHAHDRGVVHRDIKPANLMTTAEGRLKLSDFGIAKLFGATSSTSHGSVLGTAEYMSPEQADGRPVTYRSDLYSLGGVMYALLAGRPPFTAKTAPEMLQLQRFAEPDPVRRYAADVPEEIESIVAQLLAKSPEQRIPNALVLSRRLEATLQGLAARAAAAASKDDPAVTQVASSDVRLPAIQSSTGTAATRVLGSEALRADEQASSDEIPVAAANDRDASACRAVVDSRLPTQIDADGDEIATAEPPEAETPSVPRPRIDHFTHVRDEELDEDLISRNTGSPVSLQTVALVVALVALGAGVWYSLQRPSADELYDRVLATVEQGDDSLLDAEQDIEDFLAYHPTDSRTREFEALLNEIEIRRFERQFERRSRRLSDTAQLSPVERAYTDALRDMTTDPVRSRKKFRAIIDLFRAEQFMSPDTRHCLQLAARQIEKIDAKLAAEAAQYAPLLASQLRKAHSLGQRDPVAGRRIFQSIVDLYGDSVWAKPLLEQARQQMTWLRESEVAAAGESDSAAGGTHSTASESVIAVDDTTDAADNPPESPGADGISTDTAGQSPQDAAISAVDAATEEVDAAAGESDEP
jgi:serine/threonine-protein kinase